MQASQIGRLVQREGGHYLEPRSTFHLAVEAIRPVLRIVHQRTEALNIPTRIIVDHEIVLIRRGEGQLIVDDAVMPYAPGDLLFIPPFVPHSFITDPSTAGEHIAVHFDFAPNCPPYADALDERTPYQVSLTHGVTIPSKLSLRPGDPIGAAIVDVLRDWQSTEPLDRLSATTGFAGILVAMARRGRGAVDRPRHSRVDRVIDYVREHYARPLTADALAQVAGLSVSRLNVLFRQETGQSPLEFVRYTRIECARRLLGDPDLSVKEIAALAGFDDVYHFSKVFRRIDGVSPSRYREALLAGTRPEA